MNSQLSAILASKRAHRSRLAALPVAEKLRLLDAMRERSIILRRAGAAAGERRDLPTAAPGSDSAPESD